MPETTQYPVSQETHARLEKNFTYHAPNATQLIRFSQIRGMAWEFATLIQQNTPPSREQALAMTKLEEVVMWANAAIARNE